MRHCFVGLFGLVLSLVAGARPAAASGGIDASLGSDGAATVVVTSLGGYHPAVPTPDGLFVGMSGTAPSTRLHRAFPDGTLDPSFGEFGFVDLPSPQWTGLAVQTDGRIVLTGASASGGWLIRRYETDGTLDATFGTAGEVEMDLYPSFYDDVAFPRVLPDGKILLNGRLGPDAALARLNPDGSLDTTFGTGGSRTVDYGGSIESFSRTVLQPDGKILATISSAFGSVAGAFAMARFEEDGSIDTSFGGGDGYLFFRTDPSGNFTTDLAVLPDGKILMTGISANSIPARNFVVYRFMPDGSTDGSFGSGGGVVHDLAPGEDDESHSIVLLPSGRFLIVGQIEPPGPSFVQVGAARFEADGSLDTSFGSGGFAVAAVDDFSQHASPTLLPDGDVLVPGSSFPEEGVRHFYLRFTMCGPCDVVTAGGSCASPPPAGCVESTASNSSSLSLRNFATDRFDRLKWSLRIPSATSSADFGNPSVASSLRLCLYTGAATNPTPLSRTFIEAGGQCDGVPCWKALAGGALGGWKRKDRHATSDGVTQLLLKPGTTGKARLIGRGERLRMPAMPMAGPVHARLQSASGKCWEATFGSPRRNTATEFGARVN